MNITAVVLMCQAHSKASKCSRLTFRDSSSTPLVMYAGKDIDAIHTMAMMTKCSTNSIVETGSRTSIVWRLYTSVVDIGVTWIVIVVTEDR